MTAYRQTDQPIFERENCPGRCGERPESTVSRESLVEDLSFGLFSSPSSRLKFSDNL